MNESQLIARVLSGDPAAEKTLYDAHVDRIYRLAYRMTGDETMAQDYTQDTFIRIFDRLADFQGRSALSTWIHSIAVSVVLSGLRKVKRLKQRETELSDAAMNTARAKTTDVALKIRLHRAIDSLADEQRLVFVMHDVEGYKHEEIAAILDVPVGTTKSRLSRARQELRSELTDRGRGITEEDWL